MIKAFKGFNLDLKCRNFQYKEGETYTMDGPPSTCNRGFHACENPVDVTYYYGPGSSVYGEVELRGEVKGSEDRGARRPRDSKHAANEIVIKKLLSGHAFIKACMERVLQEDLTASNIDSLCIKDAPGPIAVRMNSGAALHLNNSDIPGAALVRVDTCNAVRVSHDAVVSAGGSSSLAVGSYSIASVGPNSSVHASHNNAIEVDDDSAVVADGGSLVLTGMRAAVKTLSDCTVEAGCSSAVSTHRYSNVSVKEGCAVYSLGEGFIRTERNCAVMVSGPNTCISTGINCVVRCPNGTRFKGGHGTCIIADNVPPAVTGNSLKPNVWYGTLTDDAGDYYWAEIEDQDAMDARFNKQFRGIDPDAVDA